MQFHKHVRRLFAIQLASRAHAFLATAARRPRIAVTALFCLAVFLIASVLSTAGLIHRYRTRVTPASPGVELAGGPQAEPPAPPAGLSRRRKGFDQAIAVLRSAADKNQRLEGYYKGVAERTRRQAADVENVISGQESVNNQKLTSVALSGAAGNAGSAPSRSEAAG